MKKLFAVLAMALAMTACVTAQASPQVFSNPFKSIKAAPPPPPIRPAPPWTTTTNPSTNLPIYMGGPVIIELSPNSYQIAWISTVNTAGNIGTTPMLETVLATNVYTGLGTTGCEIFDTKADSDAAMAYVQANGGYPGFNGGCIGYVNPNSY